MDERAYELYESWINGNRKNVITEITTQPNGTKSALLAVLVFQLMHEDTNGAEQDPAIFRQMLKNRIED